MVERIKREKERGGVMNYILRGTTTSDKVDWLHFYVL